jgi:hypothetical protein
VRIIAFSGGRLDLRPTMPDKPLWCGHLDAIAKELRSLPYPWVDRSMVERLLQVKRRRAQQILQPCVHQQAGTNGVADREELLAHLERLASREAAYYEHRRRQRLAETLGELNRAWTDQPKVFVEAPHSIVKQELTNMPEGVSLQPGEITIRFSTPVEALEKLLAIAMAVGNDLDGFERQVQTRSSS